MPFNFPIQQNNFGQLFAQGISNALATYQNQRMLRRQQTLDEQTQQDRQRGQAIQDYQLGEQGVHLLKPGEMAPSSVFSNIASAVKIPTAEDALSPKPAATVAQAGKPQSGSFEDMIASAMQPSGEAPQRYSFGPGYYVDRQEASQNAVRQADVGAQSEFRRAIISALPGYLSEQAKRSRITSGLTAAGVKPELVGAAADNPTLAADLLKPAPAKLPSKEDKIAARISELVKGGVPLMKANQQARLEFGETNADREISPTQKFQADQSNKILDDFARDTKNFEGAKAGWDVLVGASKQPSLATPFAVTDAYARITNPNGVVRPTTQEMLESLGSLGQRMRKAWEKTTTGGLPPDILADFQRTMYGIMTEHKKDFDATRSMAIKRGRDQGVDVSPYLKDYTLENLAGATEQQRAWDAAAAALKQQGKDPVKEIGARP